MRELSKELYEKLLEAESLEEVAGYLKAEGVSEPAAEEVWEKLQEKKQAETETQEMSLEELDDVAGGTICVGGERDWFTQGCAATVEKGSSCWHTDGGCAISNIDYRNTPNCSCPRCGRDACHVQSGSAVFVSSSIYRCRACGEFKE